MQSSFFIGRSTELDLVLQELSRTAASGTDHCSLVIWGPEGIGKSTLAREIVSQLLRLSRGYSWLGFGLSDPPADLGDYVLALADSWQNNHVTQDMSAAEVRSTLQKLLSQSPPSDKATTPPARNNLQPDVLAEFLVEALFLSFYRVSASHKNGLAPQGYAILFVIDDYDALPMEHKGLWLALRDRILKESGFFNARFLILSRMSPGVLGWATSLGGSHGVIEIKLNSFNREEAADFLDRMGATQTAHAAIYEETQGVPGLLEKRVRNPDHRTPLATPNTSVVRQYVESLSPREREYVVAAAFLGTSDPEGLSLFGGPEFGKQAFAWLAGQPTTRVQSKTFESCELQPIFSQAVRQVWHELQPEKSSEFARRVESWRQLVQLIPDRNQRRFLCQLAPFARFTRQALDLTLPADSQALWDFSEQNPACFTDTPHTRNLADTLKPVVQSCGFWMEPIRYEQTQAKLMDVWQRHRKSIVDEIASLEKELADNEQQRQSVCVQIQEIQRQIETRAQQVILVLPSPSPVLTRRPSTRLRSLKSSLAIQMLGVVSIYAGFLLLNSAREMAFSYIGLGAYLFAWGVYSSVAPKPQLNPSSQESSTGSIRLEPAQPEQARRSECDLNLVRLRSITLENRQKSLFAFYARQSRKLNECYERLNESFI
jgi:hypothetical protein